MASWLTLCFSWGSINGFLFVRSGAGQDWRIDRAGGESMGPACQPSQLFSAGGFNWCKLCAMIHELATKPATTTRERGTTCHLISYQ